MGLPLFVWSKRYCICLKGFWSCQQIITFLFFLMLPARQWRTIAIIKQRHTVFVWNFSCFLLFLGKKEGATTVRASHVWMSNHSVKCEHIYIDTTKFQFNTSNYTSVMEKTIVAMALGKNCRVMAFENVDWRKKINKRDSWFFLCCNLTSFMYLCFHTICEHLALWETRKVICIFNYLEMQFHSSSFYYYYLVHPYWVV